MSDNGKSELKEDFNSLILIINLPTLNVREISFKLEKNENFKNNELNELYKYISYLQKENVEIRKTNENLNKKIDNLEKRMNELNTNMEKKNKWVIRKKN